MREHDGEADDPPLPRQLSTALSAGAAITSLTLTAVELPNGLPAAVQRLVGLKELKVTLTAHRHCCKHQALRMGARRFIKFPTVRSIVITSF